MPLLDKLKRRLLNLWLLEYTLADVREWLQLHLRRSVKRPEAGIPPAEPSSETLPIGQIVVISLPFRTDRRAWIQQQMEKERLPYRFFDAIHGQTVPVQELDPARFAPLTKRYLPKGSIGCALSHVAVWQEVAAKGWQSCLIFEDDVILIDAFAQTLNRYLSEIPADFDLVYLGSGKTSPADIRSFVSPHVFVPFYPREGLFGYLVSAKGSAQLIRHVFPIRLANGGIDTVVGKLVRQGKIKAYHFLPVLCQADLLSPSNIPNPGGKEKTVDRRQ